LATRGLNRLHDLWADVGLGQAIFAHLPIFQGYMPPDAP
jgi:hypothetical protein